MQLNSPIFTGSKVEEDPQDFIIKMKKIFRVMYTNNIKGVKLSTYYLKGVAY